MGAAAGAAASFAPVADGGEGSLKVSGAGAAAAGGGAAATGGGVLLFSTWPRRACNAASSRSACATRASSDLNAGSFATGAGGAAVGATAIGAGAAAGVVGASTKPAAGFAAGGAGLGATAGVNLGVDVAGAAGCFGAGAELAGATGAAGAGLAGAGCWPQMPSCRPTSRLASAFDAARSVAASGSFSVEPTFMSPMPLPKASGLAR